MKGLPMKSSPGRVRNALFVVLVFTAILSGCTSHRRTLHKTAEEAGQAVVAVRPQADVSGIKYSFLDRDKLSEAVLLVAQSPSRNTAAESIETQTPTLLALGIMEAGEASALRTSFIEPNPDLHGGVAIYDLDLVLIRRDHVADLRMLAHEIAHIVTARTGYLDDWNREISMSPGEGFDPAWVDLDALISYWSLVEGEAQLTALAADYWNKGGPLVTGVAVSLPVEVALPGTVEISGPGSIEFSDGRVIKLKEGEVRRMGLGLFYTLNFVAYEVSLATFQKQMKGDFKLEEVFAATWRTATFTTRELLFPKGIAHERSRLHARIEAIKDGLIGLGVESATRVGTLLMNQLLQERMQQEHETVSTLRAALVDDAVLSSKDYRVWITDWDSTTAATMFSTLYCQWMIDRGVKITSEVDGTRAVFSIGEAANTQAIISALN